MGEKKNRMIFDEFAARNGFDALQPENWYKVTKSKLLSMKVTKERE